MNAGRSIRARTRPTGPRRQRGVVMWVALGVLIIMTLAGLAMLRQMGGGVSIAGNLAFKQGATAAADLGTEVGRAWYTAVGANTVMDQPGSHYFSSWGTSTDPTTFDWSGASSAPDAAGNTVKFVIHRLCRDANKSSLDPTQVCSSGTGTGSTNHGCCGPSFAATPTPLFRVTTQVSGPRNTVSYIQVVTE